MRHCGLLIGLIVAALPARAVDVFSGESCVRCHAGIRDAAPRARLTADANEATHDVIVVGAGVAGLTAAYRLRDLDVLILEKEASAGGKVRRELWGRARYPAAAGYMAEVYLKPVEDLFAELGIKGDVIPEPGNGLLIASDHRVIVDPFGAGRSQLPLNDSVREKVALLKKDMDAFSRNPDVGQVPPVPEPEKMTELQRALDKQNFREYMEARYGDWVADFADRYSRSLFGVDARKVSAWTGLVFFSADFGDGANITWDGGPGIISEKLAGGLGSRLKLGALVTAVLPDESGVTVEYEIAGKRRRARAKTVVMAVPSFVSLRIVSGLPDWKKEALSRVRYSAYAVAIVALDKQLYKQSFDLWNDTDTVFTDLEQLDWGRQPATGPGTPAQILEAFVPLGEVEGRKSLLNAPDEKIGGRVAEDLERLFPGAQAVLHGVRIIRWGHAMPIDYPGFLTEHRAAVEQSAGRLVFAGVDTQMPCIEGAITSGLRSAQEARRIIGR